MHFLERLLQYRWTLSLLMVAILPVTLHGALKAWQGNANRVADWMPDNFEATRQLARFVGLFGSDELLMISWPGCTLDDPRIAEYRDALLTPVETVSGRQPLFREVLTGPGILAYFAEPALSIPREEALTRMTGWAVSEDHRHTCLIALVSAAGAADRHAAVAHVRASAERVPGLDRDTVRIAGPTIEGVAIDEASSHSLLHLNFASFAICLLIMTVCLRNLRVALLVFLIALFNEQMSMALIYYCGSQMNSILLLTANLMFVLTISSGIHLVNYYRDAVRTHSPTDAAMVACRRAWKPTVLATITTVCGLISLTTSEIKPITQFGAYSAAALILAVGVTIIYTTLHFSIWPAWRSETHHQGTQSRPAADSTEASGVDRWVRILGPLRLPLILGALGILIMGYLGSQRLRTSVGLRELLSAKAQVVQDSVWLEQNIGPLVPVEVVLDAPAGDARATMAQFRAVVALHRALEDIDESNAVISTATFVPTPPEEGGGFRQRAEMAAFRHKLQTSQEQLGLLGYLSTIDTRTYWRLTLRTPGTGQPDYGQLLQQVRAAVDTTLAEDQSIDPADVIIAGGIPLVYQAQEQLLNDLITSFLLAFGLVLLTLMLLFRSVRCGLICMIPNVLPSALVFGTMGWRGTPVEIGSILTASVALGISVDDSLHFITWFRHKVLSGGSVREAVAFAYSRCGAAMVQTTMICSFGLLVFSLSAFAPIARFGWCMFLLLSAALVADLIVLPAILLSPAGRLFLPRPPSTSPGSLRSFALQVAGPREFAINVALNTLIAIWVFHGAEQVPLVGWLSLLVVCGPMSFILPVLTTYFGYLNGCAERWSGRAMPPWPEGTRWGRPAIVSGLIRGIIICPCCVGLLLLLNVWMPGLLLSKWEAAGIVGLYAGILGYVLHARAVVRAGRLGQCNGQSPPKA